MWAELLATAEVSRYPWDAGPWIDASTQHFRHEWASLLGAKGPAQGLAHYPLYPSPLTVAIAAPDAVEVVLTGDAESVKPSTRMTVTGHQRCFLVHTELSRFQLHQQRLLRFKYHFRALGEIYTVELFFRTPVERVEVNYRIFASSTLMLLNDN